MLELRLKADLGGGDYGWLNARHHFRVTPDGNPAHRPLGPLVVWNDDVIAPGTGFPMHGHQDMEIISCVLEGAVTHRDSTGAQGRTVAGDVQVMSAASGIRHEERNADRVPLRLFQIWLRPRESAGEPRWSSRPFPKAERAGQWAVLASGLAQDQHALPIRADARVLGATLKAGQRLSYAMTGQGYLVPAVGAVTVNAVRVEAADGLVITHETQLLVEAIDDTEVIMVEVF
ncbi:pirin family protein [Pseudomonas sp. 7P_10.2_Bac1]|uniref:pirin family protein n=1 Tax=Pseudomonas sp. 7P_10.2_Bac1 TaxID=2971614 RepID=UPI0021C8556B|nr:pirin family protein [Pseudomonas sp. 7P_10.2_Bac1]MCU1727035.1 pirin family protein [Pseudomonas sp. 7P_10.2_Bac1]